MQERGRSRRGGLAAVRRREIKHFLRSYGNYIAAGALFLAVVSGAVVLAAGLTAGSEAEAGNQQEATEELQQTAAAVIETTQPPAELQKEDVQCPFNTMSQDWSGEDLWGWKPYTVPEEYQRTGGAFPEVMQKYTYIICNQSGVDYAVVLALIEAESGYKWDAEGEKADTGYMQIVQKWHEDRMERLNAGDLCNPFQNVRVGVVGEFVCDCFYKLDTVPELPTWALPPQESGTPYNLERASCLTRRQLEEYAGGSGKPLWGWHISHVQEYEKSLSLPEVGAKKAPQSWCYIGG